MLGKTMLLFMIDYNHRINVALLDKAANLASEQWTTPLDTGQRSLHQTLFHLLAVEEEWRTLCQQGTAIWDSRAIADYPDPASLRAFSDQEHQAARAYVESQSEDDLLRSMSGQMPEPGYVVRSAPVWHLLLHMLYHSAQHRSEAALMLTRFGHSPGEIDFYGFGLNWFASAAPDA